MRTLAVLLFVAVVTTVPACKNIKDEELTLKERELAIKQQELELKEREARLEEKPEVPTESREQAPPQKAATKYMYVLIKTNEPELHRTVEAAPRRPPSEIPGYFDSEVRELPTYKTYTTNRYYNYTSDIATIDDYNEDKRYMEIEKFNKQITRKINYFNNDLEFNERSGGAEPSVLNERAEILSRKSFVFDSYKEASEHRSKN
jgi:hypothetical protein